ncbi:MAG: lysophospholipase L1-like esterase [Pirellulaceae bacterium]|jgi:lysophospholipase L1-like esterase
MKKMFQAVTLLLVAVACTVATAKEQANFKATSPEPRGDKWWTTRHDQKLEGLKSQQGKVDLLMIGDSITHGWEGGGKETWAKFYANRNAFNIGYSGDRTEHVLWRLANGEADGISPKAAVIMIGTNNTGHRQDPPEQTAAGIKAIIADLRKRLPETKLLLLAVFPRDATKEGKLRQINDGINELISKYGDDKHVFFLNINDTFLDDDGNLPKEVMPDLLHPRQKGYAMWAEAIEPTLKKLLGE